MKFKVGDEVYFQHVYSAEENAIGVIIDYLGKNDQFPYKVKFDNKEGICMEEELTLAQAYKNELKLKKALGLHDETN